MKTVKRTITLEAAEIIGFGKKGNAITDVEDLVIPVSPTLLPRIGDSFVREPGTTAWRLMRANEMGEYDVVQDAKKPKSAKAKKA